MKQNKPRSWVRQFYSEIEQTYSSHGRVNETNKLICSIKLSNTQLLPFQIHNSCSPLSLTTSSDQLDISTVGPQSERSWNFKLLVIHCSNSSLCLGLWKAYFLSWSTKRGNEGEKLTLPVRPRGCEKRGVSSFSPSSPLPSVCDRTEDKLMHKITHKQGQTKSKIIYYTP